MRILLVVLCGGAGSRLWLASRQAFSKPFMKLGRSAVLRQATKRVQACGTGTFPSKREIVRLATTYGRT